MQGKKYDGQDPDFHQAVKKAWESKQKPAGQESVFKVEIYVYGNNPLSGYGINLIPGG